MQPSKNGRTSIWREPSCSPLGLALLFPLLLILNLKMNPALAGLALIPTTLPMVFVAPLAGRWYDGAGGRPPLVTGFAVLLVSTLLLAWGVHSNAYLPVLPGLLLYGVGLALVLPAGHRRSLDSAHLVSRLGEGGRVVDDLQTRPWGGSDGQVIDRYGLHWLIGFEGDESD
jgi:MFS family permease